MLNEKARRALLVSLIEKMKNSSSWCGETHVQKCIYFLQDFLGVPLGFNYILYKHGPYSFDLNDELAFLRGNSFLKLHPRRPYGPSLSLGERGQILKNKYEEVINQYNNEIDFVVEVLANKPVTELERVATALYVEEEKNQDTDEGIVSEMVRLKPHINKKEAREALEYLKMIEKRALEIGLIQQVKL